MTPKQLELAGKTLYGVWNWQKALADDLGVAKLTVHRWLLGQSEMPEYRECEIVSLLKKRHQQLGEVIKRYE